MFRRFVAIAAFPMAGLLAQAPSQLVHVTISSTNNAAFRLIGSMTDSSRKPIVARGTATLELSFSPKDALTVAAVDSVSQIRIEASQNGKLIGTAEGPFVGVLRDSTGVLMVAARSNIPPEPFTFSFSRRRP